MSAYPDLHDHIRALEEKGLLMRVTRPINKDTEMHPPCLRRSEAVSDRAGYADEMQRRGISPALLDSVLAAPEQRHTVRPARRCATITV